MIAHPVSSLTSSSVDLQSLKPSNSTLGLEPLKNGSASPENSCESGHCALSASLDHDTQRCVGPCECEETAVKGVLSMNKIPLLSDCQTTMNGVHMCVGNPSRKNRNKPNKKKASKK